MKQRITFVMMMILLITGSSFTQDKQDWKFMHPTPQVNLLRKIKAIDADSWVTVGANGTYMQTSNSGANWYFHHFAGEASATLATTQNYDMWFFNENTGIVVGDAGYIGRTTNGGVSFDTTGNGLLPTSVRCWAVWFADANTGYVGAGGQGSFLSRILKTTNGGVNWSLVYSSATNYVTALGGVDANNVTAAWSNGTTVITTNGGTSWTETAGALFSIPNNITYLNSTTGFACGSGGQASRTTNAGVNWTPINTPTSDWAMFQIKAVSATEIYAVGDPSFLYKSTDLGTTWTSLPIAVTGPATTFIWYSLDKVGSTLIMSGDYGIVAVSNDGGSTWSSNSNIIKTALNFDITTVPGTSKYWIVGRAAGAGNQILYSNNSGSTWTGINAGVSGDFQSISMINANTGYMSGTNNQIMKTTDGGATWFLKTGPSPVATSQLYSCEFIDENTGWVFVNFSTVAGGNVFKTTNGGDNWTQYTTGASSENIYSADMVDANTGYCTMNQSGRPLYRTTNGGVNWTALTTGLTGSLRGVTAPDANTVYVAQTGGTQRVAKSTNGGANWTLITLPVAVDCTSMDFKDANTGYVVGNTTTVVCRTTNGGANWTFQNTHGITQGKVFVTQGDTAWALGGNSAISRYIGPVSNVKVSATILMEAMYSAGTNLLARKDNVKMYLRSAYSPYAIVDSATAVIDSVTHTGLFTFNNAVSGKYYLVMKHFNTIETWSKSGGETILGNGTTYSYNFTTSASQAFGNNMVLKGTKYCIYSGDPNQDGIVDGADGSLIDTDAFNIVSGSYIPTDLDADGIVDATDYAVFDNNAFNFIGKITP
ncbi:MAG: YCF48-related protein [Ignavibacteria bacterium]